MTRFSRFLLIALSVTATAAVTAPAAAAPPTDLPASSAQVTVLAGGGTFQDGKQPYAYDRDHIPAGASATVSTVSIDAPGYHATRTLLRVRGLLSGHMYGAHLHAKACGAAPTDAGPHFQYVQDPVTPSVNPKFANASNEIWLDFTTDAHGDAIVYARNPSAYTTREPSSLVIHAMHTATDPGNAGTAGPRLACASLRQN
jgi:Cu-Zn family superoxide dismutase